MNKFSRDVIIGWLQACINAALRSGKTARAAHIATLTSKWSAL